MKIGRPVSPKPAMPPSATAAYWKTFEKGYTMSNINQEFSGRDERIAAWLMDELDSGERAAFERDLQSDPVLHEEVEAARRALAAAREWLAGEPAGIERAEQLPIPQLAARPARVVTIYPRLWRAAAAAALLMAGFFAGRVTSGPTASNPSSSRKAQTQSAAVRPKESPAESSAIREAASGSQTLPATQSPQGPASTESTPSTQATLPSVPPSQTAPAPMRQAAVPATGAPSRTDAAPVRRVTDENGRIVIETTLADSGVHAIWVVDGSFRLASVPSE